MNALTRLTNKHLSIIFQVSKNTATKRRNEIQQHTNKPYITVSDLANLEGYSVNYIVDILK